jgi:2-succinyl-5-enolpyruvyl-6-hydroxy-3-cyclohexene-1-carboxylate synthase
MRKAVNLKNLFSLFREKGIEDVVISPGSRNAPMIEAFASDKAYHCHSIIDERSAAFFALGISQISRKATILTCTSGTAGLNYSAALAEAYYQGVPLIALTADRPKRWIDQQEGQSIRQNDMFSNFVKGSFELESNLSEIEDHDHAVRILNEAINLAHSGRPGPVHINVPLEEPLYGREDSEHPTRMITDLSPSKLSDELYSNLSEIWEQASRIMILVGQMHPEDSLQEELIKLKEKHPGLVILTESISNCYSESFINCIDRVIDGVQDDESYRPYLLITFGENLVSKKLKALLRKQKAKWHWSVKLGDSLEDTFNSLTHRIRVRETDMLHKMNQWLIKSDNGFEQGWAELKQKRSSKHSDFLENIAYSDFQIFEKLLSSVPEEYMIQMGNSTVVRYAQLFDSMRSNDQFANRGTSGIDGCTSTAVGATLKAQRPGLLITGDVAFLYDSNAFLNEHVPAQLRVIVINNSGGGIFKIIEGPEKMDKGREFLESPHKYSARHIVEASGLEYRFAKNMDELETALETFFELDSDKAVVLEVFSDGDLSADILKSYFNHLKQ